MRAYYYDNIPGDQRLPHDYTPSQPVSSDTLTTLGVKFWAIPVDDDYERKIDAVAEEQGYKNRDTINVSKEGLGAVSCSFATRQDLRLRCFSGGKIKIYEDKIKGFFEECVRKATRISKNLLSIHLFPDICMKTKRSGTSSPEVDFSTFEVLTPRPFPSLPDY